MRLEKDKIRLCKLFLNKCFYTYFFCLSAHCMLSLTVFSTKGKVECIFKCMVKLNKSLFYPTISFSGRQWSQSKCLLSFFFIKNVMTSWRLHIKAQRELVKRPLGVDLKYFSINMTLYRLCLSFILLIYKYFH